MHSECGSIRRFLIAALVFTTAALPARALAQTDTPKVTKQTGKNTGGMNDKLDSAANKKSLDELRTIIQNDYAYIDIHKVDWDAAFKEFGPKIEAATSPGDVMRYVGQLLAKTKDGSISLKYGGLVSTPFRPRTRRNMNLLIVGKTVPNFNQPNITVRTGKFDDGIGYILILDWAPLERAELNAAFSALDGFAGAKGLIVDIRSNRGGDEKTARDFAACFASKPALYGRTAARDKSATDGFAAPVDQTIEPSKAHKVFAGKVALLVGNSCLDSAETFALMMRTNPNCRIFGDTTYGCWGNAQPHKLDNGLVVLLPSTKFLLPNGTPLEGTGVAPDVKVDIPEKDFLKTDAILAAALEWLRK